MKIEIAGRLRPFSHLPGVHVLLPGTTYAAECFPTLLRLYDVTDPTKSVKEWAFPVTGPLKNFTVVQDLERGCITVFGEGLPMTHLLPDLTMSTLKNPPVPALRTPRLSFGMHKSGEWERMKARGDLREIFPLWFRLGAALQLPEVPLEGEMFSLLAACEERKARNEVLDPFWKLFLAGFRGMMVPRLVDEEHQGLLKSGGGNATPLYLLAKGAMLIRSLFYSVAEFEVSLLPFLPTPFFAGRFIDLPHPLGTLDMEWSKREVKKVILRGEKEGNLQILFPPECKSCRLRTSIHERGLTFSCGEPLAIKSGSLYLLDQFKK